MLGTKYLYLASVLILGACAYGSVDLGDGKYTQASAITGQGGVYKIGNPYNQNGQPLININQQTLDEISEKNGWITFKNKKLSKAISFVEYNNQELSVNSDSSSTIYNNQFEDIQKIIFVNAQLSVNPYNQTQLFVKCKNNNNGEINEKKYCFNCFNLVNCWNNY